MDVQKRVCVCVCVCVKKKCDKTVRCFGNFHWEDGCWLVQIKDTGSPERERWNNRCFPLATLCY